MRGSSVTIGITTYNAESTITAVLDSAISQTLAPVQIIVVDDASTDKTLEIIQTYSRNDTRFLVIQNDVNSGVAVSRNRILESAIGDFIAFFDDDDVSNIKRLQLQLNFILSYEHDYANGAPVLCHSARKQTFPDGRTQIERALGHLSEGLAPAGLAVARHALMGEPIEGGYGACATCSQMARTSTYRQIGGFNPKLRRCEDFDLAIRVALNGGHFPGMQEPLVYQQMTPSSDKTLSLLEKYTLEVFKYHHNVFTGRNQYQFCCNWIRFKFSVLAGKYLNSVKYFFIVVFINPKGVLFRLRQASPNRSRNRQFAVFARSSPHI